MPSNSVVTAILARLEAQAPDHERFQGAPLDIRELSAIDLGRLWPALLKAARNYDNRQAKAVAEAVIKQAAELDMMPALDAPSCLDAMRGTDNWNQAIAYLSRLVCERPPALSIELRRILGDSTTWSCKWYQAYALARFSTPDALEGVQEYVRKHTTPDAYLRQEFDMLDQVDDNTVMALAGQPQFSVHGIFDEQDYADPTAILAEDAAYVAFSRDALERALRRLEDIHTGKVPYVADGAFSVIDSPVIAQAARVAAWRDEAWFGALICALLPKACFAPTSAKTAPAQSLAIALGHAIEAIPTPESVQALREALAVVRHASIQKKLTRNLKPAERALAERPEVALRMTKIGKPSKRQQAMLGTCLESGYWQTLELCWTNWCDTMVHGAGAAPFVHAQIWLAQHEGRTSSFMISKSLKTSDAKGRELIIAPEAMITLWHPLHADEAERDDWQALLLKQSIRQPIRQAFREFYLPAANEAASHASMQFAGHEMLIRPLIGLARREGWSLDRELGLQRRFGEVRVTFAVDAPMYPGYDGAGASSGMTFERRKGYRWQKCGIGELDPVVYSEACRAVDLLVSVAGFAIDDAEQSSTARAQRIEFLSSSAGVGQMTDMRRRVLTQAFQKQIDEGTVIMDDRRVHVGRHAVHLTTGRVTKAGAPVDLQLPAVGSKLAAVPWLPYDEVLLEKVADTVAALLHEAAQARTGD